MEPSQAEMTALFELLDKNELRINLLKEPLEAHLVEVEGEDGQIIGEVVELRNKTGSPVLVMNPTDYEELLNYKAPDGD